MFQVIQRNKYNTWTLTRPCFLAGSGKEQEREIYSYCIAMRSTLINISIIFVVLLSDDTKVYTLEDRTA